jgi:hypothetical protein
MRLVMLARNAILKSHEAKNGRCYPVYEKGFDEEGFDDA